MSGHERERGDAAVAWLREAITKRKAVAEAAAGAPWEAEGDDPTDDEVYSASGEPDTFGEMVAVTRGPASHANMAHIALNDPRDVIARCEAELRILGWADSPALPDHEKGYVLDAVASGYRHREGYETHWGQPKQFGGVFEWSDGRQEWL